MHKMVSACVGTVMVILSSFVLLPMTSTASPVSTPTAVVQGVVDCSNVLSTAGFAGAPSRLTLSSGTLKRTAIYPQRLPIPGFHSLFGQPEIDKYKLAVPIPAGRKTVTVHWTLSCQDKDGNAAGTESGQFALASRFTKSHPATRDICNHGGTTGIVLTICNPALETRLGDCAWEVFTAAVGGDVLPILSIVMDPPKSALQLGETALSAVTGPLGGLILACAPAPKPPTNNPPPTGATGGSGSTSWPVHRNDGSLAFFAFLGASFILPDWTSCDPNYCLAESSGTVYVYDAHLNQIGTISSSVVSPTKELLALGIPQSDVNKLLAPSG